MVSGMKALVVAINYKGSQYQLNGCEKDGEGMRKFFAGLGYEVTVLSATEAELVAAGKSGSGVTYGASASTLYPTKANIESWVRRLTAEAGLTKFGFFYAGHGTQLPDAGGSGAGANDEADGLDEALVCQNPAGPSFSPRQCDLWRDDDVIGLFHACLRGKDVEAYLMLDACHSATALDLGWGLGSGGWKENKKGHFVGVDDKYKLICMSAAQDNECALETAGGGNMTNKFLACAAKGDLSLSAFYASFSQMSLQAPHISSASPVWPTTQFGVRVLAGAAGTRAFTGRGESGETKKASVLVALGLTALKFL